MKQRQCPADEYAFLGANRFAWSDPPDNMGNTDGYMLAPIIFEKYGDIVSKPITYEAIRQPSTWMMMADTFRPPPDDPDDEF